MLLRHCCWYGRRLSTSGTDLESFVSGRLATAEVGDDERQQVRGHDGRRREVIFDPEVVSGLLVITSQHFRSIDQRHV